jgi:hypothetical protein
MDGEKSKVKEAAQWVLTLFNTAGQIFEGMGKAGEKLPESFKQHLPGFLGLSLDDEALFNGILTESGDIKDSITVNDFLSVCADYERNRFINVVTRMDVEKGTPKVVENRWNQKAKKMETKVTEETPTKDRRRMFLKNFAKIIRSNFRGDMYQTYEYCVGGRLMIPDPITAKVIRSWSDSCRWFKKVALDPFSVHSVAELRDKVNVDDIASWIETNINQKAPEYKGVIRSGLPTKRLSRWVYVMFMIIALGTVLYGFIWG